MNYKIQSLALLVVLSICAFSKLDAQTSKKPKIAIAGLGIESSTFSPARTDVAAFHPQYGSDVFKRYSFFNEDSIVRKSAQWVPTLVGKSLPGGMVKREAYESLVKETLDLLQKDAPYDGLFFDIHGAMSVEGLDDPEGDFIQRIRKVIGQETMISTAMDLHGNVSKRLAEQSDLITCYRMAPHEDAWDTKRRAVINLIDRLTSGKGKPLYKARIPIPILLPGEKTSTRIEPAKSVYAAVAPAAAKPGVIDAAIWVGYAWADEPRNHAVVMVTGDDQQQVASAAEDLAKRFWEARDKYAFVAPTGDLKFCMDQALASKKRPFFISDSGDNPTAGGAGDVTWTLTEILKRPEFKKEDGPTVIYASIPGPELVEKALTLGVGKQIDAYAGAEVDDRYAPPVHLVGTIESIEKGDRDAEVEVVVRVGSVRAIITKKRKPYHKERDFTRLGLNPRKVDLVFVKIGYLEPDLYNMQADWLLALTPGGVDQDLERLPYKRIQRPMFPLDKDMPEPDLKAKFIPLSGPSKSP